jgi:sigma-B regulation protein RsbU (phosphoserine phosphatase)
LDRRFFRSRGNLAVALQEFGLEIPQIIQQDALITRIGGRLCQLVDLPRLAIYRPAPAGEEWLLAGVVGHPAAAGPHAGPDGCDECPGELQLAATALRLAQFNEPYWIERSQTRLEVRAAATREQAELLQRLQERDELARLGIALLVPMLVRGRLVGLFALPPKHGSDDYQLQDLELLTLVAGQMALQLENSRLYEEELKKQKLEEQLTLARSIQSRLLPERLPLVGGLELAACNFNSAEVSGDYYDLIERDDGQLVVIISDVSGKGIPASLLASSLQASLRAHCAISDSPGEILDRVNRYLYASTDPTHFATLFLAFVDPARQQLRYSSGGHNAPILRRADGSLHQLDKGGLPLGAFDFGSYPEETIGFTPGDMLFLYTDGLTETVDADDEEFGTERVERLLGEHHGLGAEELLDLMNAELRAFRGREQADDDVTLLVLKALHTAADNPAGTLAYAQRGLPPLTRAENES